MMTIYSIKPLFQKGLQPIMNTLHRSGVTPNHVTLFALFLSVGAGLCFAGIGPSVWWLMPIVFLVRMALNAIDGMMARQYNLQSPFGNYLNEIGDILSDLFLYLPFVLLCPWSMGLICVLSIISEIAGILATSIGKERRYDGPMGKSDRALCLGVVGFLIAFGWIPDLLLVTIFGGMSLLLCLTIYSRIKKAIETVS